MSHTYKKIVRFAGRILLIISIAGMALPAPSFAQSVTAATVNFAGTVVAVDPSTNSLTAEVRWFYGGAIGTTANNSPITVPVAGYFCPGKTITVHIPAGTKIVSFRGTSMTLSQVQAGAYFNGTVVWQNGMVTAQTIRFTATVPPPPRTPAGFDTTAPGGTRLDAIAPNGIGSINFAGKVTATNEGSISAEVQWFYGGTGSATQDVMVGIAGRLCPGKIVTIQIPEGARVLNFRGAPLSLTAVPAGAYFNATVTWQNGGFTAKVIRLTTTAPKPPATPTDSSITTPPPPGSVEPPTPQPPLPSPSCGFWGRFLGRCAAISPSSATLSPTSAEAPAPTPSSVAVPSCGFFARLLWKC